MREVLTPGLELAEVVACEVEGELGKVIFLNTILLDVELTNAHVL